jgi:hypothetical protein
MMAWALKIILFSVVEDWLTFPVKKFHRKSNQFIKIFKRKYFWTLIDIKL